MYFSNDNYLHGKKISDFTIQSNTYYYGKGKAFLVICNVVQKKSYLMYHEEAYSLVTSLSFLSVSFPMSSFDPPENIRKPLIFDFQGDQKGTLGRKKLIEIKKIIWKY